MHFSIQTLNAISNVGLDTFNQKHYLIEKHCDNPDAFLVRSQSMHTIDIPQSTQAIGRAGAGTNNIPIEKMTARGIPVFNTPGANANAVKELVITGMLLACRHICSAWKYGRSLQGNDEELHQLVEKNKNQFSGVELPGKTLAIIGLGNIGVKVANTAIDLGMHVIGFDPSISVENAWKLSANVKQALSLREALQTADFISLHVPLLETTRHLINDNTIKLMKRGVILLNFARQEIIDHTALSLALSQDHIHTYVCDFINNLLKEHPRVISLPHLGASTKEAEENCATMIAQQIQDYLEHGNINHAVNFPSVNLPRQGGFRIAVINRNVPNIIAQLSTVLSEANINIIEMINKSRDLIAYNLLDTNTQASRTLLQKIRAIDGVIRARTIDL